jgi:hypothetical protein
MEAIPAQQQLLLDSNNSRSWFVPFEVCSGIHNRLPRVDSTDASLLLCFALCSLEPTTVLQELDRVAAGGTCLLLTPPPAPPRLPAFPLFPDVLL